MRDKSAALLAVALWVCSYPLAASDGRPLSSGCVGAAQDLLIEIVRNPDGFYVNVHNTEFPNGAVRGQLSRQEAFGP